MEANRKTRRQFSWQNWSFVVLFLVIVGLLAWLSTRYDFQADWTANKRHTLSEATKRVLATMDGPISILAFARAENVSPTHKRIDNLLERYHRAKPDLTYKFINPDVAVDQVRKYNVREEGELVIKYKQRQEHLTTLGEQSLTNTLQRLVRSGERHIVFITGHGERRFDGVANHDLKQFADGLKHKGMQFAALNLSANPKIPADTSALVIASPQVKMLPGELKIIEGYITKGGNLLWLSDPDDAKGMTPLADQLGLKLDSGIVVDPSGALIGINNPMYVLVTAYPKLPFTEGLDSVTLFPMARGLEVKNPMDSPWHYTPLLTTLERSWIERGQLAGKIRFDKGVDTQGPIHIGYLLTRDKPGTAAKHAGKPKAKPGGEADKPEHKPQQRIAVIGDGDFISNTYIGNGLNEDLGERLLNWLSQDDRFIDIPARTAPDTRLAMTRPIQLFIGLSFFALIPLLLVGAGVSIWWKRRKR